MKKKFFIPLAQIFILAAIVLTVSSCNSMLNIAFPWNGNSSSWRIPPENEIAGTIWISGIAVDKSGSSSSIENEASCLLPLLFLDRHYLVIEENENADFIAEVKIREREFINGWKTVCSIGVEIYFRNGKNPESKKDQASVPLAAARTVRDSRGGLSSSKNLHRLLETAVGEAINALERNGNA